MPGISLVILAAGMGSRYKGLKQLDGVGPANETIMDYSVFDAVSAGFDKIVYIIRKDFREAFIESVSKKYGKIAKLEFAEQELDFIPEGFKLNPERIKPWGTGHAMLMAAPYVNEPFAVINADDFYGKESYRTMAAFLESRKGLTGEYAMVGYETINTLSESGGVSRGVCEADESGFLTKVEEHHNLTMKEGKIKGNNSAGVEVEIDGSAPVSMNFWGFTPDIFAKGEELFKRFLKENIDNPKSEFYIPYIVNSIINEGSAGTRVLYTPDQWFGVTYKEDREFVVSRLRQLTEAGEYPTQLFK
jgi:choline kinase